MTVVVDASEDLAPDTIVGDYVIEGLIGMGGMGTVYSARHPVIGKRAAIKVLCARACSESAQVDRFIQEAQAVNRIGHPNIVDIFAFGVLDDGRSYLVMELLGGETLSERLERDRKLDAATAAEILIPLTRALEAAHAAGVIHRDLKPENVMLIPDEDGFRVKLLDFGIAKLSTTQPSARRTATGMTMGTPLFMAPEQARGEDLDARADLYALGAVAYAMVCGETPFENEGSPVEILHAHISKPPPSPRALAPDLPADFEALILELLSKDRAQRPDLGSVRRRLKALSDPTEWSLNTDSSYPIPKQEPVEPPRPRRRWWVAGVAGAVVAVAAVAIVVALGGESPSTATSQPASPALATLPAPAPPAATRPTVPPPPPATTITGTVDLVVEPARSAVLIDGTAIALDQGRAQLELEPGDHIVTTKAAGFVAAEKRVLVVAAQVTPIQIRLSRVAPIRHRPAANADSVVNPFANKKR